MSNGKLAAPASATRTTGILGLIVLCLGGTGLAAVPAPQSAPVYQESGGMVIIEVESTPATDAWSAETALVGFTGSSYYAWRGSNVAPTGWGTTGLLSYQFNIANPGRYVVRLHCYGEQDMYKSVFFRMDNDQSFSTPDHNAWVEYFVNAENQWSWDTRMVAYDGATWEDVSPTVTLAAGLHTLQFSAREAGFCMDRIAIFLESIPEATAENLSLPPSSTVGGPPPNPVPGPLPVPGPPRTQKIGNDSGRCGCGSIGEVSPSLLIAVLAFASAALLEVLRAVLRRREALRSSGGQSDR